MSTEQLEDIVYGLLEFNKTNKSFLVKADMTINLLLKVIIYCSNSIDNKYKQEKINALINTNIQKCINWCIKYRLEYNSMLML